MKPDGNLHCLEMQRSEKTRFANNTKKTKSFPGGAQHTLADVNKSSMDSMQRLWRPSIQQKADERDDDIHSLKARIQ